MIDGSTIVTAPEKMLPQTMDAYQDYSALEYWQHRYLSQPNKQVYDWYLSYPNLKAILAPLLSADESFEIFIPGVGTSSLPADLYLEGYHNISCIDSSEAVINVISERWADLQDMDFSVLDATELHNYLPEACFDLVIDKALLDTIACSPRSPPLAHDYISEMLRVLKPGGSLVVISRAAPEYRMSYFTSPGWHPVKAIEIPVHPNGLYHAYVLQKR